MLYEAAAQISQVIMFIHTAVLICMCNDHNRLYGKSRDCMEFSEQTQITKMSQFESPREPVL